jgi:hypothetical protein
LLISPKNNEKIPFIKAPLPQEWFGPFCQTTFNKKVKRELKNEKVRKEKLLKNESGGRNNEHIKIITNEEGKRKGKLGRKQEKKLDFKKLCRSMFYPEFISLITSTIWDAWDFGDVQRRPPLIQTAPYSGATFASK